MRPNGPCLVVGSTFGNLQTCRSSLATVPKQLESTKPQAAQLSTPLWDAMSVHLRPTERLVLKLSRPLRASTASRFVPKKGFTGFVLCVEAFDAARLRLGLSCHRHPWHTAFANGFTTSPEALHVHLTELVKALLCSNLRLVHRARARPASQAHVARPRDAQGSTSAAAAYNTCTAHRHEPQMHLPHSTAGLVNFQFHVLHLHQALKADLWTWEGSEATAGQHHRCF